MKNNEISIRDPFVLCENGKYYMYGTRSENFGQRTGGFDVYVGTDLENWSEPEQVFFSEKFGLNKGANWAPEVHKFNGRYYLFATFEQQNGNRGTFSYLVFCHEHVQILNGTICYVELNETLSAPVGEPVLLFYGSDAYGADYEDNKQFVTDGPFIYRGKNDRLYMIWSTFIEHQYHQCVAYSDNGDIDGKWIQLEPIFTKDGGHGMVFRDLEGSLKLTLHCPNEQPLERPVFFDIIDTGNTLVK